MSDQADPGSPGTSLVDTAELLIRPVQAADLDGLLALEERCFATDRLSRRSFRHWIQADNCAFLVAELRGQLVGYSLILFFRGTILARLYSIAVDPACRGGGIARRLMESGEALAEEGGRVFLRLEVSVDNRAAIRLYESMGYQPFGIFRNYYEDENDALRMQKCIRHVPPVAPDRSIPWLQQNTPFTCGPAALMMAMSGLSKVYQPTVQDELRIWREATTIFMTSGHGGCHPIGLALAAHRRGFSASVWINRDTPPFVDSVRDESKKRVIELVHGDFFDQASAAGIAIEKRDFSDQDLDLAFRDGAIPVILISTYRLDGKKAPHWVTLSGYDDDCLYVHDSDPDPEEQSASGLDSQYLPIARGDFVKMSRFGASQLRTAVILRR
ncbi:MAG: ribosomal-protein-alanine acetyltransferase [Porticoccaceae bacterium]|nr:ribosomal-protein-alanine acetyltransferase [Porticoccaceae bacterium]